MEDLHSVMVVPDVEVEVGIVVVVGCGVCGEVPVGIRFDLGA